MKTEQNFADNAAMTLKNGATKLGDAVDSMSNSAHRSLDAVEGAASDSIHSARRSADELLSRGEAAFERFGAKATDFAEHSLSSAKHAATEAAVNAKGLYNRYSDATCSYVAENPVRSIVISAAVGAAVTALLMSALQNRR